MQKSPFKYLCLSTQMIVFSQACIPFLCYSANIWIVAICLQGYLEETIAHECLYTEKRTLQELVPANFKPYRARSGCLGECEEAPGDQETKQPTLLAQNHMIDGCWWWERGGVLEIWWSPWPEKVFVVHPRSTEWVVWAGAGQKDATKDKLLRCRAPL